MPVAAPRPQARVQAEASTACPFRDRAERGLARCAATADWRAPPLRVWHGCVLAARRHVRRAPARSIATIGRARRRRRRNRTAARPTGGAARRRRRVSSEWTGGGRSPSLDREICVARPSDRRARCAGGRRALRRAESAMRCAAATPGVPDAPLCGTQDYGKSQCIPTATAATTLRRECHAPLGLAGRVEVS